MPLDASSPVPPPASVAKSIAAGLADTYHAHHTARTLVLYLLLVTGLAGSLAGRVDGGMLVEWWAAVAATALTSLWQQRRYAADPRRHERARQWVQAFTALSAINGLLLGLLPLLFFDPHAGADTVVPLVFAVTFTVAASHAKTAIPACAYATFMPSLGLAAFAAATRLESGAFLALFLLALAVFGGNFIRASHRQLVEALTLDRANARLVDQLRQARDAAEAASQAKSAFLAVVSHEVRTPLNAMMGVTELLAEAPLDDLQRRRLDTLKGAGDHILGLIGDMLDFSQIEAGKVALVPRPFDLRLLAAEAAELFREQAARKGIELEVAVEDGGHPYRLGDVRRLRQMLVNLLHNAIKYTEVGTVRLRVLAGRDATLGGAVEDQGPGIPPDRREAVFEPFLRGGDSRQHREGAGLGLAICRRLVGLMGGALWLEPLERGSRFRFTVVMPAVGAPEFAAEPAGPAAACQGRVLVVDDSEFGRDMVAAMAGGDGLRVDLAGDGSEAVAKAARLRYDLILMDQRLCGLDGPQALAAIRRDEAARGLAPVPVAAMTAGIPGKGRDDYLAEGFADLLAKPFSRKVLFDLLARHLPSVPAIAARPWAVADADVLGHCGEDAARLAAALGRGDRDEAARLAHRIKGVAMVFGMPKVAARAEAIEAAAGEGAAPLLAALDAALAAERRRLGRARSRRAMGPTRVLLVDDHEMVRDGLRVVLGGQPDFEVVGEAADGLDCIRMVVRHHPDLVLIDLAMPRMNGAEAVPEIRKRRPEARVVVLTGTASPAMLRSAEESGADAVVRKDVSSEELIRVLRAVLDGKRAAKVPAAGGGGEAGPRLSRRERQVLKLIVEGRRTRDIAELLGLSERTVEKHRASLGHKLGTSTPAELAALALRHGLIEE